MKQKFYVSLEVARLLKEKGYNEKCTFAYTDISNGSDINGRIVFNSNDYPVGIYPCPTKAEVIDWLDKKIHIGIGYDDLHSKWHYDITPVRLGTKAINNLSFSTRLEAEEAAIIEGCELLENGN